MHDNKKPATNTIAKRPADAEADRALKLIYQKYGPNLHAFFRDAQERLRKEANEGSTTLSR